MKRSLVALFVLVCSATLWAGNRYNVLDPITHGNLTVWPVVSGDVHDTSGFLTLDEGLKSGEVVVTEASQAAGLIRRHGTPRPPQHTGAEVNRLVLVNNSKRPLLLLAGEIVTGGKQDRVIGKDRIVPPESDPVDLSVFCVEPGRWVGATEKFGASAMQLAQPSVRAKAMQDKNQQMVWDSVHAATETVTVEASAAPTTSYAATMQSEVARKHVDDVVKPIQDSYSGIIGKLREKNAVGVVVAVNGRIIWADLFASPALLERYWPKLVRSYAAEAITTVVRGDFAQLKNADAQNFLNDLTGRREVVETEPGVYKHAEIIGNNFTVFELTSLLPKTGFPLHIAKMGESGVAESRIKVPVPNQWIRR